MYVLDSYNQVNAGQLLKKKTRHEMNHYDPMYRECKTTERVIRLERLYPGNELSKIVRTSRE